MYDNNLCCTYPEECPGLHESCYLVPKEDLVIIWRILQVIHLFNINSDFFIIKVIADLKYLKILILASKEKGI